MAIVSKTTMWGHRFTQLSGRAVNLAMCTLVLTSLALSGCTPPPPTQEIRWTFGDDDDQEAIAVRETSDGGFVVAGSTGIGDEGIHDIAILKISSTGRQVWGRTLGGDGSDFVVSLLPMPGGNFVVIGTTDVPNGEPEPYNYESQPYAVCVDGNGTTKWEKTFSQESLANTGGLVAASTAEGDVVIGGELVLPETDPGEYRIFLMRLSSDGDIRWVKTLTDHNTSLSALRITSDGNIILSGYWWLGEEQDGGYLAKADGDGNLLWERSSFDERVDYFPDLIETSQGDYVLLGHSFEAFSPSAILVKTDSSGNPLWTRSPSSDNILFYGANAIAEASDGGYVLAGAYEYGLFLPESEYVAGMYLLKTDATGRGLWSRVYAKGNQAPVANFVEAVEDGGYILAGHDGGILDETGVGFNNYDMAIVKTDANGDIETSE